MQYFIYNDGQILVTLDNRKMIQILDTIVVNAKTFFYHVRLLKGYRSVGNNEVNMYHESIEGRFVPWINPSRLWQTILND